MTNQTVLSKCWVCGSQLIVLTDASPMFTVTEARCVSCGTHQSVGPQDNLVNWDAASDEALINFEASLSENE